jgi:lipopolysaccharide export system permease protein
MRPVRLVDRYLVREMLVPLAYCLGAFLVFWVAFDVVSNLDDFNEHHVPLRNVVWHYLLRTPDLLTVVLPVALLLALLYAITHHARHNEILALRAAGLSLWRLGLPYLAVGAAFSLALLLIAEWLLPHGPEQAEQLTAPPHPNGPVAAEDPTHRNLTFHNARDRRFWRIRTYHLSSGDMDRPDVVWDLPDGSRLELTAERGVWTNAHWVFFNVQGFHHSVPPAGRTERILTNELALAGFTETPDQIRSEIKVGSLNNITAARKIQLTTRDILAYKRLHPQTDPGLAAVLDTQLHARLAAPWTCLVVVFIALPFATLTGRRNVFVGVASSLFICFAYFVLQRLGMALGTGGRLTPWVAAWLPNVLFIAAGLGLAHARR